MSSYLLWREIEKMRTFFRMTRLQGRESKGEIRHLALIS